MKNAAICIAVAGFATVVTAQDFSLSMTGTTAVTTGLIMTVDVFGDASVGTHMLGGGFEVETSLNNFEVLDMTWTPASWSAFNTDGGHAGDGNYNNVIFGQLVIPGIPGFDVPAAGSDLGGRIGNFQIHVGQLGSFWSIDMQLVAIDPFSLESVDAFTGQTFQSTSGNLSLGSFHAFFIPAPSSVALLGLGGLVATRRRRA